MLCGKVLGGRGDVWVVWDGLGEVSRSVGEDVTMCEERCGSVEKCCVWESMGRPKKVFTVAGVHFSAQNQGRPKNGLTCFISYRPYFAFCPQGGDITHFENRCITVGLLVQLHLWLLH